MKSHISEKKKTNRIYTNIVYSVCFLLSQDKTDVFIMHLPCNECLNPDDECTNMNFDLLSNNILLSVLMAVWII